MKSFALTLVLLALVGVAAAFFKPAVPVQVHAPPMMGTGLDNEHVIADNKITPVRKNINADTTLTLFRLLDFPPNTLFSRSYHTIRLASVASAWDVSALCGFSSFLAPFFSSFSE